MGKIFAIAAMNEARVIGLNGGIPWRIKEDLQRFKELTLGATVIMGRVTYDSLPAPFKPLPGRHNIVVTRQASWQPGPGGAGVEVCTDLASLLKKARAEDLDKNFWIIGGAELYKATIQYWDELYLTLVRGSEAGDTFFPQFEDQFEEVAREDRGSYSFLRFARKMQP